MDKSALPLLRSANLGTARRPRSSPFGAACSLVVPATSFPGAVQLADQIVLGRVDDNLEPIRCLVDLFKSRPSLAAELLVKVSCIIPSTTRPAERWR
jgi:hypothetical protein